MVSSAELMSSLIAIFHRQAVCTVQIGFQLIGLEFAK